MSRLLEKLEAYEDFELAFLVKYKLDTYLKDTQLKVAEYIRFRGLSKEKIERLIDEFENKQFQDAKSRCPRCKSKKIYAEEVDLYNTSHSSSVAADGLIGKSTKVTEKTCMVCGFLIENPNSEKWTRQTQPSFWKRFFGKKK